MFPLDKSIKDADALIEAGKLLEARAIINSCISDIQEFDGSTILEKEKMNKKLVLADWRIFVVKLWNGHIFARLNPNWKWKEKYIPC